MGSSERVKLLFSSTEPREYSVSMTRAAVPSAAFGAEAWYCRTPLPRCGGSKSSEGTPTRGSWGSLVEAKLERPPAGILVEATLCAEGLQ